MQTEYIIENVIVGYVKTLQNEHKNVSRFTLNYDMTFLIILLNEVYKENILNQNADV